MNKLKFIFQEGKELTPHLAPGRHFEVVKVDPQRVTYTLREIPDGQDVERGRDEVEMAFRKSNAFDQRDAESQRSVEEPASDPYFDDDGFPTAEGFEKYCPLPY